MEEFDFLIIGNEPAGLWLARRLREELASETPAPRIGWVDFGPAPECFFPDKVASLFQLPPADPATLFSPAIVSPERTLSWREETLSEFFPELPSSLLGSYAPKAPLAPTSAEMSSLRYALRGHPELLPLSAGLWKRLGRAPNLHPETILAATLLCTKLRVWHPTEDLPSSIDAFRLDPVTNPLTGMKASRGGEIALQFQGLPPLLSRKWILNLPFHLLRRLTQNTPELAALLHASPAMRCHTGLFGLELEVAPGGIPANLSPLTTVLETESIPDLDEEVWPLQLRSKGDKTALTLWATAPQEVSLESTLDQFRKGLGRLNHLFPFLADSIDSLSVPLGMESCFDDETRAAAYDLLEARHWECYQAVSFQTQSRSTALDTFFPFLNCHLPYPVGPMVTAQQWLTEVVRSRKRRKKPSVPSTEIPATP